jgi:hypothetical protein
VAAYSEPDLRRFRAVTANFFFWQGLRWVPPGAALLLFAWSTLPDFPLAAPWRDAIPWIALLGGLAASGAIGAYYDRAYGQVHALPGLHTRRTALKWGLVYPAIALALVVDGLLTPQVSVSALVFAAAIEAYRRSTGGGRQHYLLAAVLCAAATFAPLLGVVEPGREVLAMVIGGLGGIYVIGGLLDHRALRQVLRTREEDRDVGRH